MEYIKICKLCGNQFVARSKKAEVCKAEHTSVCCICGNSFVLKPPYEAKTCSRKCSQRLANKARKITMQAKYGVDNPMQLADVKHRAQATCIEKYGVDNPSKSTEIQAKIKQHFQANYGVDNAMQVSEFRAKQNDSVEAHYSVRSPLQNNKILEKVKQTNLDRYGYENVLAVPEIRDKILTARYARTGYYNPSSDPDVKRKIEQTCMVRYGVPYNCMRKECREASSVISNINKRFADMLHENNIVAEFEFRIDKYSYDLKVNQTLIEIDPTYTHNTFYNHWNDVIDSKYHIKKSKCAVKHGFRCIHVFDWDSWTDILHLLQPFKHRVYARQCIIKRISKQQANAFTNEYHIQGQCNGQNICYGLYYDDELVEVMTFGTPRYNRHYDCELLRLCTRFDYSVVGGASKLFKQFKQEYSTASVISYCDLAKFTGHVYEMIGMKLAYVTEPNKIWSKADKYVTQNLLNQRGYDQLFNTNYGHGTSNEQLMLDNGWLPVYDCGQAVYIWN